MSNCAVKVCLAGELLRCPGYLVLVNLMELVMGRPFILLGDKTSHGGVVISASETSDCDGKGIARVGDRVTCPQRGHGSVTTIVTGDPTAIIDGQPAARHGDTTACGATLIASQSLTTD